MVIQHGVTNVSCLTSAMSVIGLCVRLMQCLFAAIVTIKVRRPLRNGPVIIAKKDRASPLTACSDCNKMQAVVSVAQPTVADPRFYDGNFLPSC